MKTVLFINKGADPAWPAFLQLEYLVDGWRRQGLFEVCSWRPEARTARAAVPALAQILGEESDWQAVIVCDLRSPDGTLPESQHFENPFDFVGNAVEGLDPWKLGDPSEAVNESPYPLVRLCQMLGGIPEKVREQKDASTGIDTVGALPFEYPQSDQYFDLVERYRTGLPRPRRIICVSPRTFDADVYHARIRDLEAKQIQALREAGEWEYDSRSGRIDEDGVMALRETGFWERNDYPSNARFVVFDWEAEPVAEERDEWQSVLTEADFSDARAQERAETFKWLRFWTATLTILTAELDSADIKPYRLHRINPVATPQGVRASIAERWSEWIGAREQIETQIALERRRLERAERGERNMPDLAANVAVRFDVPEMAVRVNPREVGPLRDVPRSDQEVWEERQRSMRQVLRDLLRSPRRGLRRAVAQFRRVSRFGENDLEYCILTEDECVDLEEDTLADELTLARSTGRRAFRLQSHADKFDRQARMVTDSIEARPQTPERRSVFVGIIVAALLGLVACLPAMVDVEAATRATAVVSALSVVPPIVLTIAFIISQQRRLREAYQAFGSWLTAVAVLLGEEAIRLGRRLSLYARVRKEWAVTRRQENLGKPTRRGAWLTERLAFVDKRMGEVSRAVGEPSVDLDALARMRQQPWDALSKRLDGQALFDACAPHACMRPYNEEMSIRRFVTVPFEFVESVELVPLRIH